MGVGEYLIEPFKITKERWDANGTEVEYLVQWRAVEYPHAIEEEQTWEKMTGKESFLQKTLAGQIVGSDWLNSRLEPELILEERTCRVGDYFPGIHAVARTPD